MLELQENPGLVGTVCSNGAELCGRRNHRILRRLLKDKLYSYKQEREGYARNQAGTRAGILYTVY